MRRLVTIPLIRSVRCLELLLGRCHVDVDAAPRSTLDLRALLYLVVRIVRACEPLAPCLGNRVAESSLLRIGFTSTKHVEVMIRVD